MMASNRINIFTNKILTTVCHMKGNANATSINRRFSISVAYNASDFIAPKSTSPSSSHCQEKSESVTNRSVSSHPGQMVNNVINTSLSAKNPHRSTSSVEFSTSVHSHPSELRNASDSSILSSPSATSNQDVHREMSTSGSSSPDKQHAFVLKTAFDQALSGAPSDDVSLLASRRIDPSTVRQIYYFDTLAFTKKLESSGFTREQAEGCAECLVEIINTTLDHQGRHMVTKPQQEIAVQQLMSEIVSVKKDMTLLQKSEFSSLKTETEKMSIELSQVQGHMNDEIVKLKGQFSLDINLERGRAIEAHAENEKRVQQLHNKIDTEIANLKTIYEVYRNDVFKYAGGTVIAVGTLMLGVIRLWH